MGKCQMSLCHNNKLVQGLCHRHRADYLEQLEKLQDRFNIKPPSDFETKFWAKVHKLNRTDCWEWQGHRRELGYGIFCFKYKRLHAHRVSYEIAKGPIPEGLEIDHLCKNPPCVNPSHLEAVTHLENMNRSDLRKNQKEWAITRTHCKKGHLFDENNTRINNGRRICKTCAKLWMRNNRLP